MEAKAERPDPAATLQVFLTVAPELPAAAGAAMVAEATGVWRRAGIQLVWLAGRSEVPTSRTLRVLVIPRPASIQAASSPYVVAELLNLGRPNAVVVASIDSAEQVVAASHQPGFSPASLQEDRLGLVLGRAVAHEIGHYLLNTAAHSRSGLMRATFDVTEFADRRSSSFELDTGMNARPLVSAADDRQASRR